MASLINAFCFTGGFPGGSAGRSPVHGAGKSPGGTATIRDKDMSLSKKKEALLKYELYAPDSCTVLRAINGLATFTMSLHVLQFDRFAESVDQRALKAVSYCRYQRYRFAVYGYSKARD
jgi:hypothetical protein